MVTRNYEFTIPGMDCPAEEQLIRFQLDAMPGVTGLRFDLPGRKLVVVHSGNREEIQAKLESLKLGSVRFDRESEAEDEIAPDHQGEKTALKAAFAINASLFVAELVAGILAYSLGLIGDSLDMLADAYVYALALAAVGGTARKKRSIAQVAGMIQLALATAGLFEVIRRFLYGDAIPDPTLMIVLSAIALAGNVATLLVLNKNRDSGVHMQAVWLCTSVDVQVNALVIATGVFIHFVPSLMPDLLVGGIIFVILANGARKILALGK